MQEQQVLQEKDSPRARFEELHEYFQIDTEGKLYPLASKEICLGKIMVDEKALVYHRFVKPEEIKNGYFVVDGIIGKTVDYIVFETLNYSYTITRERLDEFGDYLLIFGAITTDIGYWEKRPLVLTDTEKRRRNLLGDSWYKKLESVINSPYMSEIGNKIRAERQIKAIYPAEDKVFRAFKLCSFEHTKVVILGQNPYPTKQTADGLAFSYLGGIKPDKQKALDVIFEEIQRDAYNGFTLNADYDLSYLAKQGVLLLNSSLTVVHGDPKSHLDIGWQRFTKIAIYELLIDTSPKVFMLWGNVAQTLFEEVYNKVYSLTLENQINRDPSNHLYLKARHPAADVYEFNQFGEVKPAFPATFAGCRHFSQANEFLKLNQRKEIKW